MMLCDISVVFNLFADAFGLMSRLSSENRQVLVRFQSSESFSHGCRFVRCGKSGGNTNRLVHSRDSAAALTERAMRKAGRMGVRAMTEILAGVNSTGYKLANDGKDARSIISAIRTSGTRFVTPSCRRAGSRIFGGDRCQRRRERRTRIAPAFEQRTSGFLGACGGW
jgi:hypothetical protein